MTERKTFDARAIGSITSGTLLLPGFSKLHEAVEWVAGHPVWKHELPAVSARLTPSLLAQFSDLPTEDTLGDWEATAQRLLDKYPNGVEVEQGTGERTKGPMQTLAEAIGKGSVAP